MQYKFSMGRSGSTCRVKCDIARMLTLTRTTLTCKQILMSSATRIYWKRFRNSDSTSFDMSALRLKLQWSKKTCIHLKKGFLAYVFWELWLHFLFDFCICLCVAWVALSRIDHVVVIWSNYCDTVALGWVKYVVSRSVIAHLNVKSSCQSLWKAIAKRSWLVAGVPRGLVGRAAWDSSCSRPSEEIWGENLNTHFSFSPNNVDEVVFIHVKIWFHFRWLVFPASLWLTGDQCGDFSQFFTQSKKN